MPLYDLVAIVKAATPRAVVGEVLRRAAVAVLDAGGVVTDVKSFGTRELAYEIRKAGESHKQVRARVLARAPAVRRQGDRPPPGQATRRPWPCRAAAPSLRRASPAPRRNSPDAPRAPRNQGQYVQLSFATNPKTLSFLQHDLRTDERVVRWVLTRQPALPPLPKQKELRRLEAEMCAHELVALTCRLLTEPPALLSDAAQHAAAPPPS